MTRRTPAKVAPLAVNPAPEDRYVNSGQLRVIIPASNMSFWRWQRDPEIAFPVPVKLGDDGRNYWWLPDVRAWMRRRKKRQVQAARHRVIHGNSEDSNSTDVPADGSASAAPPAEKTRADRRCGKRPPGIGHDGNPSLDRP